jgi:hypothetical protein
MQSPDNVGDNPTLSGWDENFSSTAPRVSGLLGESLGLDIVEVLVQDQPGMNRPSTISSQPSTTSLTAPRISAFQPSPFYADQEEMLASCPDR